MSTKQEPQSRRTSWTPVLIVAIFIILACLAVVVCGITLSLISLPRSTPIQLGISTKGVPSTEIITPTETITPTVPALSITAWLSIPTENQPYLNNQIDQFMHANPNIRIQVEYFTEAELANRLSGPAQSDEHPDIASLTYNSVATLRTSIQPLDLNQITDLNDFIVEAMALNEFEGKTFGLPWLRNGCAPSYLNLSLFQQSPDKLMASHQFINFMALSEQQNQNYQNMKWYPTRKSVYERQHIACDPVVIIPPDPAAIPIIRQEIAKAAPPINVRYKIALNLVDVTGVMPESIDQQQQQQPAPKTAPVNWLFQTPAPSSPQPEASAAAVLEQPSAEEIQFDMANGGVFVGALVVNTQPAGFPAEPGQYAVQCKQLGDAGQCSLLPTDPNLSIVQLSTQGGVTEDTVSTPAVYVEQGSRIICYRLDGLKFCFKFR